MGSMKGLNIGIIKRLLRTKPIILIATIVFISRSPLIFAQASVFSERANKMLFMENYEAAVLMIDSVLQKDSLNFEAHYKIALAYQNLYLHDKAIGHLNKAKALTEDKVKILAALGKSYFTLGTYDKAQQAYEEALLKDSLNKNLAYSLARVFVEQTLYPSALKIYSKLREKDLNNSYILKQLGYCYLKMNDYKNSTINYELSNIFNPSDLNVALQLIINFIFLNQIEHADALIESYLKIYPSDARFTRLKGDLLFKKNNYKEADSYYQKVIAQGDSSAYVFQKSGLCNYLYAKGNDSLNANEKLIYFDKAAFAFVKAVEQDSTNPILFMYLALSFDKSGKFSLGINAMSKAKEMSISGLLPDICVYLGDFYKEAKEYLQAIEEYKEALYYKPDNITLLRIIGDIYSRELKDYKTTVTYYERYLKRADEISKDLKTTTEYLAVESGVKRIKKILSASKGESLEKEVIINANRTYK